MTHLMRVLVFSLAAAALPLLPGAAPAYPLSDVPHDHPAAPDVGLLWREGIIRGTTRDARCFEGDRRLTEPEAVCLAARLSAAVNVQLVRRCGDTIDAYLDRWYAGRGSLPGCPYRRGHWAEREWVYLRAVRAPGVAVLDGWPSPLPTRYEAAISAARVLRQAREAAESPLVERVESDLQAAGGDDNETADINWIPECDGHEEDHAGPALEGPPGLVSPPSPPAER